jgi:formylglycine-generating enzyme required for sulfatase activity
MTLPVPGGTFYRSYDGVTFSDKSYPATVGDIRLDKYEVTVARFREFVSAIDGGWRPVAGAGKHTHLNGGRGLSDILSPGKFETGWDSNQDTNLCSVLECWQKVLWAGGGGGKYETWSTLPGASDGRPIVGVTWAEAYAFCIWDGGFLPSEAEWNYAASGGPEQRVYPWSTPPTVTSIDCSYANYGGPSFPQSACVPGGTDDVGSQSPKGDGKWGHADLAGNTAEWTLDWWAVYVTPSVDAANAGPQLSLPEVPAARTVRGGAMDGTRDQLLASSRNNYPPTFRTYDVGFRCARAP